jgi:hypothetical protein
MATRALCFKCYRQLERERKQSAAKERFRDPHTPAVRREHLRLHKGFDALLRVAHYLSLSPEEVKNVIQICGPHLEPIRPFVEAMLVYPDKPTPTLADADDEEREQ